MTQEEWTIAMENCVGTIRLVNNLVSDFVYSLPSKYDCYEEEASEWGEKMQEQTELIMLRLDLVNKTLPKLTEALTSFTALMSESVEEEEE